MRTFFTIILSFSFLPIFSQAKLNTIREHKVKLQKEKTRKTKTKKVKENMGYGNKRLLRFSYGLSIYNKRMNEKAQLNIANQNLLFGEQVVGAYQVNTLNRGYENTVKVGSLQDSWVSTEIPSAYEYRNEVNTNRQAIGVDLEARFVKDDGFSSPTGFYINSGIYLLNKSISLINYEEYEVLMPLGIGVIIPGEKNLWVEVGASSLLGINGSLGAKFDFSIVWRNIKFTPSFMYLQDKGEITFNSGGMGLGIAVIPKKVKRYKRRRK